MVLNRLELQDLLQQECERITVLEQAKNAETPKISESQDLKKSQPLQQGLEIPSHQQGSEAIIAPEENNEENTEKDQNTGNGIPEAGTSLCDTSLQDLFNVSSTEQDVSPRSEGQPLTSTQISFAEPRTSFNVSEVTCSLTSVNQKTKVPSPISETTTQLDEQMIKDSSIHDEERDVENSEKQGGKLVYTKGSDHKVLIRKQRNKNLVKSLKQKMEAQKESELKEISQKTSNCDEVKTSRKRDLNVNSHNTNRGNDSLQETSSLGDSSHKKGVSPSTLTKLKKFQKRETTADHNTSDCDKTSTLSKGNQELTLSKENQGPLGASVSTAVTGVLSQSYDEKLQPQSKNIFRLDKTKENNLDDSLDSILNSPETVKLSIPKTSVPVSNCPKPPVSESSRPSAGPSWLTKVNSLKSSLFKVDVEDNDDLDDLNIEFDFNPSKRVKIG